VLNELLDYDTLDAIADTYIPSLAVLSVAACVPEAGINRLPGFAVRLATLTMLVAVSIGLMLADQKFGWWPAFGLDYSTHTALALSLVLWLATRWPRGGLVWWTSLGLYCALMLYQRYHTLSDIMTTAMVVAPLTWLIVRQSRARLENSPSLKRDL
jgi:hypothetical protein